MIIRKLFEFNGQHIVRNCSSYRCKYAIHAHTYKVELFFTSKGFDNAQMILDFGLIKGPIKEFIKSFNNSFTFWNKENKEFKEFIKNNYLKWVEIPTNPSAESFSLLFFKVIDNIIKATYFRNNEKDVSLYSVRVHETNTGYAQSFREDLKIINLNLNDIKFSDKVREEWEDPFMYAKLLYYISNKNVVKPFNNPYVKLQIDG